MMFELGSFNLIKEFERASNEPNAEQLASSSAQLQPYRQPKKLGQMIQIQNDKQHKLQFNIISVPSLLQPCDRTHQFTKQMNSRQNKKKIEGFGRLKEK